MAGLGFFAGGLADSLNQGLNRNQQADFQQKELQLQQQGQQMAQQRFEMSRIDGILSDAAQHLQQTIDAGKSVGEDPKTIMSAIQGMYDQYNKLAISAGRGPGFASAQLATWMASPPSTQVESAQAAAKVNPMEAAKPQVIGQTAAGEPVYGQYNKGTQKYEPMSAGGQVAAGTGQPSTTTGQTDTQTGTNSQDPGEQFLAKLPEDLRNTVKGVANYEINPNTFSTRTEKGMSRSRREIVVELARQYAAARGQTYDQVDFTTKNKAMQAFAQRVNAISLADSELQRSLPILRDASNAVNRTQYKTINSLIEAWQENTGGTAVVQLGEAINTTINLYARAINPTGGKPTVNDLNHANDVLQKAWSKGQIEAGVAQLQREVEAAKASLPDARNEILGILTGSKTPPEPANSTKDQSRVIKYKFNKDTGELEPQ